MDQLNAWKERVKVGLTWELIIRVADLKTSRRNGSRRASGKHVVLCCFHQERHASLWLFPNGGFKCYGCQRTGDILDFILDHFVDPSGARQYSEGERQRIEADVERIVPSG